MRHEMRVLTEAPSATEGAPVADNNPHLNEQTRCYISVLAALTAS
jgi:hypothetical protein